MAQVMCFILAAGKGTRMKSGYPKVLHRVCGRPMLWHVINAVQGAGIEKFWTVIGYGGDLVREEMDGVAAVSGWVEQKEQLGTGHAVRVALEEISERDEFTLIVYGDTPLLRPVTLKGLIENHITYDYELSILTAVLDNPKGYGRIIRDKTGSIIGIVEEKDSTADQREIREINTGIYCVKTAWLEDAVKNLTNDNAQGEFYLTDIVGLICSGGGKVGGFSVSDVKEIEGVNDRVDLACAQEIMERRICEDLMKAGVTMYHPGSLYVEVGISIGKDSVVYPNCSFVGSVRVGENCFIHSGCYLRNAYIGDNTRVGVGSYLDDVSVPANSNIPPFSVVKG